MHPPACSRDMEIGLDRVRRQTEEGGPDRRLVFQAAFLLINSVLYGRLR